MALQLLQQQCLTPPPPGSISSLLGARRTMAGGFFDKLKKSFDKEVEQNKEFKESLSKLRKETGDLTGKAQENTSKLTESMQKYTSAFSTRLSETTDTLSKSSQAVVSQLKEKMAAAQEAQGKGKEAEEGGDAGAKGAAAAARPTEEEEASHVKSTAEAVRPDEDAASQPQRASASTSTRRRRKEKAEEEAAGEETVKTSASAAHEEGNKTGEAEEGAKAESSSSSSTNGGSTSSTAAAADGDNFYTRWLAGRPPKEAAIAWAQDFKVGLKEAFTDLFGMQEKSTGMKKHIYQQASADAAAAAAAAEKEEGEEEDDEAEEAKKKAAGGGALVVVKQQQKTWERLAEQLKDAPIIQEILKAGTKLADTELGRQAGKLRGKLNDRVEDAREMWETSQNPLVYKLSSMWDDLTSETELGIALREIRRADPEFVLEDWVGTLTESFLPLFFKAYLKGDLKTLKPYLSEGMYKQMAEEFRLRKAEGLALDPHVLEISNAEIVQAKIHDHQPVLVLGTLIQHINCVRNREGKIVEGKEDEVRASFYLLLFVREYDEKEGALQWKIQERYLGFSQPFI